VTQRSSLLRQLRENIEYRRPAENTAELRKRRLGGRNQYAAWRLRRREKWLAKLFWRMVINIILAWP